MTTKGESYEDEAAERGLPPDPRATATLRLVSDARFDLENAITDLLLLANTLILMSQNWRDTDQGEIFGHFGGVLRDLHAKANRAFCQIYHVDEYRGGQPSGRA